MGETLVEIAGVPPDEAPHMWPYVGPWIDEALTRGGACFDLQDVMVYVAECDMQLWTISVNHELKASFVTAVNAWPGRKILTAVAVGGTDMPTWVGPLTDLLDQFAAANGCSVVDCHGRRGWKKALEAIGWEESMTTFSREVSHGR